MTQDARLTLDPQPLAPFTPVIKMHPVTTCDGISLSRLTCKVRHLCLLKLNVLTQSVFTDVPDVAVCV